ncbi:MAG TPA: HEAT repeat domain-containing protein, partial [Nitrospira sp.]|nr:HEAT repeat domain-containing protein [Nitrospira sp.]
EQLVYSSKTDEAGENFAFTLYSDGIRELTLHPDITEEDVLFFFDALWDTSGPAASTDDDIVTRLWTKNLPTITIVTADEVMKVSEIDDILTPQGKTPPEASLREILADARARDATDKQHDQIQKPRLTSGIMGYEVSEFELAGLERDIAAESARDSASYVLEILGAILSSERSPALLLKVLDIYDGILTSLVQGGHWHLTEQVLTLLSDAEAMRPDLTPEHKEKIRTMLERIGQPERVSLIERYLNTAEEPVLEGLQSVLLMMPPSAIPALCVLLGNLEQPAHQTLLSGVLTDLAKETPDILARHLTDRRPAFVRNLLNIITHWNNPGLADAVEKIIRYPDPLIRREVIRTLSVLRPSGSGAKIVPLVNDPDEAVRLAALKPLLTGHYTAPFSVWEPIVTAETFGDRPPAERRNIFHAMRATAGDEAVPFWTPLLTEWGWTNRKKREELALMAVDALGKLGTPAAQRAIQTGADKGMAAVKKACLTALAHMTKHADTP